ncbi:TKL protein kinase [Puccinia striiformis f. sp. tritici PST-78]|uniref:TKL protein kinase n=1 Tax=Puccinia striiformis f. sp. tritici PST-78 TaxID=1165861 RepID=A0A0L0VS20_9BASI|nr:TKL protein kinase [Puccinia striiformis f. sp. tritici PST-78]
MKNRTTKRQKMGERIHSTRYSADSDSADSAADQESSSRTFLSALQPNADYSRKLVNRRQLDQCTKPARMITRGNSKKRKRTRTSQSAENDHQQVMVLLKNNNNNNNQDSFTQTQSRSSASSSQDTSTTHSANYYINQASKTQLLRLRRDQLIQLIKTTTTAAGDHELVEEMNKEALTAFIIEARTSIIFPSQSQPTYSTRRTGPNSRDQEENPLSQPCPMTRLQTRVKSLPDRNTNDSSRTRPQQRKSTTELDSTLPMTTTRKTRSATQANNQSMINSSSSNSLNWSSSINSQEEQEPSVETSTRTPRRYSNRRKAVKFIGHRSGGPTPIAYRTRRSSNHRSVTRPSFSVKSRNARGTTTPNNRSLSQHELITPTRSSTTRKLRNGKVIPLKRMIGDPAHDDDDEDLSLSLANTSSTTTTTSEHLSTEDHPDQDGPETIDVCSTHSNQSSNSDDDHFDIAEDDDDAIQIDSEEEEQEGDDDDDETLVDLSQATSKGLLRLKRDNLVKLCEEREIEAEGTKKDLVQHLLAWRNTNEVPSSDLPHHPSSPDTSMHSEEKEEDSTPTAKSSSVSVLPTGEGTCSRPIILESSTNIPKGSGSTKNNVENLGELLDLESLNLQDKEIQSDQLTKLELIGSGGFKDVYRGIYKRIIPVAIAEIRGHLTEMDLKELRILRDLRHLNIVRFIGVCVPIHPLPSSSTELETSLDPTTTTGTKVEKPTSAHRPPPIMVVTEICTNGDLFDYLRKTSNPGLLVICKIFKDICNGLEYLHSTNVATGKTIIIHRDLKSSNVLITSNGVAKLNDFGLARIKNSTRSMVKSLVGTVNWQAPELWVAHPRYNEKVDVYSAGLVLWEMLQWHQPIKRYPFEGQNEHAIYQDVGHRQLRPPTAGMRRQWGDRILNLVEKLWAQNPVDRPKMDWVIEELDLIVEEYKTKKSSSSS